MLPRDLSCEKAQHEEKSANFGTKVPVKRKKRGAFQQKQRTCAHRSAFRLRNSPSTASSAPAFSAPFARLPDLSHLHRTVWAVFSLTPHAATRNAPAVPARKDVRLELHAPMPEDTPFTDTNSGRTQRMIEKQTRKCHKIKNARTRKAIRTTETAAQDLHSFLRNAEGRERKD